MDLSIVKFWKKPDFYVNVQGLFLELFNLYAQQAPAQTQAVMLG